MGHMKFQPKPLADGLTEMFDTVEEAFFWYIQCQMARQEGARFTAGQSVARPCDPDDIYRCLAQLFAKGVIGKLELEVLGHFGFRLLVPSLRCGDAASEVLAWDRGMSALGSVLMAKGIVKMPQLEEHQGGEQRAEILGFQGQIHGRA